MSIFVKAILSLNKMYLRCRDADNSGVQGALGMKRRLSGKLSGFIITNFTEIVRFPHLIYSSRQIGQRD